MKKPSVKTPSRPYLAATVEEFTISSVGCLIVILVAIVMLIWHFVKEAALVVWCAMLALFQAIRGEIIADPSNEK